MSAEPIRISAQDGEGSDAAWNRALVTSARNDAPPPEAQQDLLKALGLGDGVVAARGSAPKATTARAADWRPRPLLFASVLQEGIQRRFGSGALVSAAVHLALLALAIHFSAPTSSEDRLEAEARRVKVELRESARAPVAEAPSAAPIAEPPPASVEASLAASHEGVASVPRPAPAGALRVEARAAESRALEPAEKPLEIAPVAKPEAAVVRDPIPIAPSRSSSAARGGFEVLPFGEGMSLPRLIEGADPVYPREAREAKVEGTMLVKCVITTVGTLESCRVLKSLPFLDRAVLDALAHYRYTPVMFQGRAVNVEFVIPVRVQLP